MNMSSVNLELLTSDFPSSEKKAAHKLFSFFEEAAGRATRERKAKVYSIDRIFAISEVGNKEYLIKLLSRLVNEGFLEQFIRVEVDYSGLGDFPSFDKIPKSITDWRNDVEVIITPDKLKLYYKLLPQVV
jgi:hypothetical protein